VAGGYHKHNLWFPLKMDDKGHVCGDEGKQIGWALKHVIMVDEHTGSLLDMILNN